MPPHPKPQRNGQGSTLCGACSSIWPDDGTKLPEKTWIGTTPYLGCLQTLRNFLRLVATRMHGLGQETLRCFFNNPAVDAPS